MTGSAAGDGSGSGFPGAAPNATIIFVKFDFDGDRNSDAAIIDGVDYIFQKAAEIGCSAVINMSLGSDFGPHDGSTLEERGISDLTGPGKVVVIAAGNPGSNNWSDQLTWGFSMHGSGDMAADPITFRFPANAGIGDYVFFTVWYSGSDTNRVVVTSPSGQQYPPNFKGKNRNMWKTGTAYQGFDTPEGAVLVANGGDQLGWGSINGDHEIYIEISDYWGTAPATGEWTIELVPISAPDGSYHAWFGVSDGLVAGYRAEALPRDPTPKFGGRESDNAYTIGSPASADKVIAAAAYMTRDSWDYYDGATDTTAFGQTYDTYPITYYDPFALGDLAYFSGRGPRRDGVLKPEIAAPGVGIASALSHFSRWLEWTDRATGYWAGGPYHFGTNRVTPNLEGTILQGTSMACPNTTGAVALLLQADGSLDDAALRTIFAASARHDAVTDVYESTPGTASTDTDPDAGAGLPNNDWGYGRLDLAAALSMLGCASAAECDDGNACTDDACVSGSCEYTDSSAACDDGDACTTGDACAGGACVGAPVPCDDGDLCTADACSGGACQYTPTACDDGDACTTDSCDSGAGGCVNDPIPGCGVCGGHGAACGGGGDCCSGNCKKGSCKGN